MIFSSNNGLYYSFNGNKIFNLVAGFDMDWTLIKTKSGKVFPKGKDDWMYFSSDTVSIIDKLKKVGYKIVIFTNQSGLNKNIQKKDDIFYKINNIVSGLGGGIDVLISTRSNYYRKPFTGMWDFLCNHYGNNINMKKSFYCGDAAGRKKDWIKGKKKDFSSSDLFFAHNIGIPFKIPETVFCNIKAPKFIFPQRPYLKCKKNPKLHINLDNEKPNLVMLSGRPASGKTTFSKKMLNQHPFKILNQDILKTKTNMKKNLITNLKDNQDIILDATNSKKSNREYFTKIGKKFNANIILIEFTTSHDMAEHLNCYRVQQMKGSVDKIPKVVYHTFNKYYQKPTKSEGYNEMFTINFCPEINDKKKLKEYNYYY